MERMRAIRCLGVVVLSVSTTLAPYAQVAARRAAAPAALLAYPGFYQGQLVVVRGNLVTRDQPVLLSQGIERSIPLIFKGPSPVDGPVELRASFWDLGRLPREDPRIVTLGLDRLLAKGLEGDWPRPGEVIALTVTDAMAVKPSDGSPSLREIALDPTPYVGQRVKVTGQFRGRNLYGDAPQGPGLSQWDFVLRSADAAVWITGMRPRGRGFSLDIGARVDTGTWLETTGIVRVGKGLVWIEGQLVALTKPNLETRNEEVPPIPQMGPPPEVIFTDPAEGETDVPLKALVRLQFSREMNPETFKGNVRWTFTAADAVNTGGVTPREPDRQADFKYDRAKRSLEIRLAPNDGASYRTVIVELTDGIAATDGAKLKPWQLMFAFGAQ
jgi:Bacterial Ig-like domain